MNKINKENVTKVTVGLAIILSLITSLVSINDMTTLLILGGLISFVLTYIVESTNPLNKSRLLKIKNTIIIVIQGVFGLYHYTLFASFSYIFLIYIVCLICIILIVGSIAKIFVN